MRAIVFWLQANAKAEVQRTNFFFSTEFILISSLEMPYSKVNKDFSFFSRVCEVVDRMTDRPLAETWIESQNTSELNGKPILISVVSEQLDVLVV